MQHTYLTCDWLINVSEIDHLISLMAEAETLGFELRMCRSFQTDEHFQVMGFNLKMPDDGQLEMVLKHIPRDSGFTQWSKISADEHDRCMGENGDTPTLQQWSEDNPVAFTDMIQELMETGFYNDALMDKSSTPSAKTATHNQNNSSLLAEGQSHYEAGNYEQALIDLKAEVYFDIGNPIIYLYMGHCYYALQKYSNAKEAYKTHIVMAKQIDGEIDPIARERIIEIEGQ